MDNYHVILLNKLLQEVTDNAKWSIVEVTFIVTDIQLRYEADIVGSITAHNRHYYFYTQKHTEQVAWEDPNLIDKLKNILTKIICDDCPISYLSYHLSDQD